MAETAKSARVNGVGVKLSAAADSANRGDVYSADTHLSVAREYAQQAGITFSKEQEAEITAINKRLGR
jgi:hypothetical protein